MTTIAIIDYGAGNLDSVVRALEECGATGVPTVDPDTILKAHGIILPGVGAFKSSMERLVSTGLIDILETKVLERKTPFLGICLGMHLLATVGYEPEETPGLGWIAGSVEKLAPCGPNERLPHVGWNGVAYREGQPLFQGLCPDTDFYFVHSYAFRPENPEDIAATTPYCTGFVSALSRGNIHAVQFHPEKSQKPGFAVLKNFISLLPC